MSKTIEAIEAELAAARAQQAQEQREAAAKANLAAAEESRKAAVRADIENEEAGITHLEEKIAARRARIAELQQQLQSGC